MLLGSVAQIRVPRAAREARLTAFRFSHACQRPIQRLLLTSGTASSDSRRDERSIGT